VIVVDDCSTDRTIDVLESYSSNVKSVFLDCNAGQCNARNIGLALAKGTYVKFLDSDDVLENGCLPQEVDLANSANSDIVVSGWISEIASAEEKVERIVNYAVPKMEPVIDSILQGRAVPTSAALYRRDYISLLKWDTALKKLDDWDWFCQ